MRRLAILLIVLALLAGGCGDSEPAFESSTGGLGAPAETPVPAATVPPPDDGFLRCDRDAALPSAPADWYRNTPRYVGNEQPVEQVRSWAATQPGFQEVWVDRSNNGWVTVAFDRPVAEVQQELVARFPDDGVVAVQVDWNLAELRSLQNKVVEAIGDAEVSAGIGVSMAQGVVDVSFGVLSDEALATLDDFVDAPICVSGRDPATARVGPQADGGEGWRLLAIDGTAGHRREDRAATTQPVPPPTPGGVVLGTRVEVATNQAQYDVSWNAAVVAIDGGFTESTPRPDVNFDTEVAVFGHTLESGSCPILIFGVVADDDSATVRIDTGVSDETAGCTSDGNSLSWAVAIDRDVFPEPPFTLVGPMLRASATLWVTEDLRVPGADIDDALTIGFEDFGAAATPAPIPGFEPDPRPAAPAPPTTPTPPVGVFPHVIEPGFASTLDVPRPCIVRLGPINGFVWTPIDGALAAGDIPDDWLIAEVDGSIPLELLLTSDPAGEPTLDVTASGRTERYLITDEPPSC